MTHSKMAKINLTLADAPLSKSQTRLTTSKKKNIENKQPFVIGVSGGTFSGKTSVCKKIVELLSETYSSDSFRKVAVINQDDFYKTLSADERLMAEKGRYNFDHPGAFDTELMQTTLVNLSSGNKVRIPKFDCKTYTRSKDAYVEHQHYDVVLFEGVFIFYFREIRDLFNLKLFVDTDADTRLSRRVLLKVTERNKTLESVLQHYTTNIKPAFEEFCLPSKKYADVIIPRGTDNKVAINLIVQHIRDFLKGELVRKSTPQTKCNKIDSSSNDKKHLLHPNSSMMNRPH